MKLRFLGVEFGFGTKMTDGQQFHSLFRIKANAISTYLVKRLLQAKIKHDNLNEIFFRPLQDKEPAPLSLEEKDLCVDTTIDWKAFESSLTDADKLNSLLCDFFERGFRRIDPEWALPTEQFVQWVQDYRDGGCKTEWTQKTRKFRGTRIKASLECSVDTEWFQLTLRVEDNGELIFDEVILKTGNEPGEYYYKFKDLSYKDGVLSVIKRGPEMVDGVLSDVPLYSLNI